MSRIFLSHSSLDVREASALRQWLVEQDPPLANDIFLDIDPAVGLQPGERWKDRLQHESSRCEAVVCLLSRNWEASHECKVEYRVAESLNKQILCARLEPSGGDDLTAEWQRCDLFGDGPTTSIEVPGGPAFTFSTDGLYRLRDAIRGAGISAHSFVWPPRDDRDRAPYRGWEPFEQVDAAVFFGRDAAIVRALDELRGMRMVETKSLFVVLGPSGAGKSSFLRAGVLPRLVREDRRFAVLGIVRPGRNAITGDTGLAAAIWQSRGRLGLSTPSLGEIKAACTGDVPRVRELLIEIQQAAAALLPYVDDGEKPAPPTLVLPLDQAEELFSADAGTQGAQLMSAIKSLTANNQLGLIVLATIRTDRYEVMQTHPELAGLETRVFDDLKPMPPTQFKEVISGPAVRASEAGRRLTIAPSLVERLLADAGEGADTLPMLSLTLARLYADYGSTGELTVEQYEAMGGMDRVVETEIDEALSTDPEQRRRQLDCLRTAFIPWLATVNPENDQPMRRVARFDDLPEESRPLVDALVAKRLMVKDQRDGNVVVEVALESLLRQWDELAAWLREQRNELIVADDVERAATAWRSNDEDAAWLMTGSRLADAEKLIGTTTFAVRLNPVREYLDASRRAENERLHAEEERRQSELRNAQERQAVAEGHAAAMRKRSRILRAVLAVTAVVAVAAVAGFGFAMHAQGQAQNRFRQATSVRLAAEAQGMLANTRTGSDARAIQQLLAADALSPGSFKNEIYSDVAKAFGTAKVIETSETIVGADLSPDNRRIITGGERGPLRLWDVQSGQQVGPEFKGHDGFVDDVHFSPDGRRVASAGDDQTVRLWNADTGEQIGRPLAGHENEVWAVAFSPDGHTLASGSKDSTVRLWNADTGEPIGGPMTGHTGPVQFVTFSPDGRRVASAGNDGTLRMWDTATGAQIGDPFARPSETDRVFAIAFSPDGNRMVTSANDGTVRVFNAISGEQIGAPLMNDGSAVVQAVNFSHDGRRLAAADSGGFVYLLDAATGQRLAPPAAGHEKQVWKVIFSADDRRLISTSEDGTVRVWNLEAAMPLVGHTAKVTSVAYSPDGHRVASASDDHTVRLWDAQTGQPIGEPLQHEDAVSSLAFNRDGLLATASVNGTLRVWSAANASLIGPPIDTQQGALTSVAFTADGRRLVTGGGTTARAWDAATRTPVGLPMTDSEKVTTVATNEDGSRVFTGNDMNVLSLWDVQTGQLIKHVQNDDAYGIKTVALSGDGHVVATGDSENLVQLSDSGTLEPRGEPFEGHMDSIKGIAWSPDGQWLASASSDKGVRIWDVENGSQIGEP
ncbi:MAG: hypothetical protein QOH57_1442, partial [Mycobacterium sp.]|nr:hypothetical protein [Mycobacterium sp.]